MIINNFLISIELILILILAFSLDYSSSVIISKSNIEMCTQNQTNNLNCTSKLVISLSIENGKMNDTDSLEFFISNTNALDGTTQTLQSPYKVTISKSAVSAQYPCIYVQDFNFHPLEQIIISDVFSCEDGALAANPTCGWAQSNNNIIPYSQGFCCKCDFSQIIGVDTTSATRGSTCGFLNLGLGSATAHCLKFDVLWYSAYQINKYIIDYTIDIFISYNNTNIIDAEANTNNSTYSFKTKTISLSPSTIIALSDDGNILARLIGDFQPPTPPNDYSNFYLTTPSSPITHTMVLEGPLNWMLIPQNDFTLDGRTCDKIGVSYYAFQTQGHSSGCQMKIGDCLHNQIYDYYLEDVQTLLVNKNPHYLFSQDKTINYKFYSYKENNTKQFSYLLSGVFNSLITLEINANDIKYVTNVSTGQIDYVTLETFMSLSNDGMMQLQITNSGQLTAQFSLGYNCSNYILPMLGDQTSLKPFQSQTFNKDIYTLSQNSRSHSCNVTLFDAVGDIVDCKSTLFNTTVVQVVNTQNPPVNNTNSEVNSTNVSNTATNPSDSQYVVLDCQVLCPGFFDYICFVAHGCWGYFARTTGIMLLCVFVSLFILKLLKNGCLCKIADKIVLFLSGEKELEDEKIIRKV